MGRQRHPLFINLTTFPLPAATASPTATALGLGLSPAPLQPSRATGTESQSHEPLTRPPGPPEKPRAAQTSALPTLACERRLQPLRTPEPDFC